MPAAPLATLAPVVPQAPTCDVPGCGNTADFSTDGSEVDSNATTKDKGRRSLPYINLDKRHENWSFSEDAQRFAATEDYQKRVRAIAAASSNAPTAPPAPAPSTATGKVK